MATRFTEPCEALAAVEKKRSRVLMMCSKELQDNADVVHACLKHDGAALRWASGRLRADRATIRIAVDQHGPAIQFALGENILLDFETASAAVRQDWSALQFCSPTLREDSDIVREALRGSGSALQFASEKKRADRQFCLEAVLIDGNAYPHVSQRLKNNREIVLAAVRQNGDMLSLVPSFRLRQDAEVVGAAVRQNGYSLEHAGADVVRSGWGSDTVGIVEAAMEQRMAAMSGISKPLRPGYVDESHWQRSTKM